MAQESASNQVDRAIAVEASRRFGILRFAQLLACGLNPNGISVRIRAGHLWRLHRGVYSVVLPNLLRIEGRWLAALYACGEGAVLSHTAAAALWDIRAIPTGPIHVTVPSDSGRRQRRGIVLHRSSTLLTSQTTLHHTIPVTKPARTLSDLRRTLPRPQYEAALRKAEIRRLDTGGAGGEEPAGTAFERRLLALCRRHGLPFPRAQQIIGPYTVDFLWPAPRLVVEMDDFRTHGPRTAFESDRARDAWLTARGFRVVRFTWRQLHDDPSGVVAVLRALLGS